MARAKRVATTVKHHAAIRAGGIGKVSKGLETVFRNLAGRTHSHFCSNRDCRTYYEDSCATPERNARCQICLGRRRTWINRETGLHDHDPRPCCTDNTDQVTDPATIERHMLAGPGPWYQCRTCKRAHGDPCSTTT